MERYKRNRTNTPEFVVLTIEDLGRLEELIGSRTLQLRDAAVFISLARATSTYSGRITITSAAIAKRLQMPVSGVKEAISRMKKQNLLRHVKDPDTGERYYRLNPWVIRTSGEGSLLGLAMKEFTEA